MALPKSLRLKGHRAFDYIHKNSLKYHGKLMTFRIAKSNPKILISHRKFKSLENLKISIVISKKAAKKAVKRNRIRRILQDCFIKNYSQCNNHKPYWLLVNLKFGDFCNDKSRLLEEFQNLMFKSRLIK